MTDSLQHIELKTGRHWISDKSVLCSEFFIPDGCPMVDSRMIKEHIEVLDEFLGDKKLPFLNDLSSAENVLSFDALKDWGQNERLNKHRIAEAYVVSSLADLVYLKQHIRLNNLNYPARVFQSLENALAWLKDSDRTTTPLFDKNE